jgi:hypothetical protein
MSHKSLTVPRRMLWISTFFALANTLHAVDGVVLINQAAATAGRVTAGDSAGFPVTLSQPGSYRLSGDLVVPDSLTTAITITADNVMPDMNGFSILGPNNCESLSGRVAWPLTTFRASTLEAE